MKLSKKITTVVKGTMDKMGMYSNIGVLECVLIDADAGTLVATNMDIFTTMHIPVTGKGVGLIRAKFLITAIASANTVYFEVDNGLVTVIADGISFKESRIENVEDFPTYTPREGTDFAVGSVPVKALSVSLCSSTEETRYWLNGVLFEYDAGKLTTVATDGHKLAKRITHIEDGEAGKVREIVHNKTVKLIQALEDDVVDVCFGPMTDNGAMGRIVINATGITIVAKLIDGNFPDYECVIPKEDLPGIAYELNIKTVRKALKAMKATENKGIALTSDGAAAYVAPASGFQDLKLEVAAGKYPEFQIGFNWVYLDKILADIDSKTVTIKFPLLWFH